MAVFFVEIMKANALAIHLLQVLSEKALLPRRLRQTPWNSEPNHLAVISVDLSKDSLIYLVASIMQRACFSQLPYIHYLNKTFFFFKRERKWINISKLSFYLTMFDLCMFRVGRSSLTAAENSSQRSVELKARVCPVSIDDIPNHIMA